MIQSTTNTEQREKKTTTMDSELDKNQDQDNQLHLQKPTYLYKQSSVIRFTLTTNQQEVMNAGRDTM